MNHLFQGSFFPNDPLYVMPQPAQGHGLRPYTVNRPKIILGISVTPYGVTRYHASVPIFPVVLDTGCNASFELDALHFHWLGWAKDRFPSLGRPLRKKGHRGYELLSAHIWLHVEPYTNPTFMAQRGPFLLAESEEIRLMDTVGPEPVPRFPLLGLNALKENRLIVHIDASCSSFDMYEA